LYMYHKFISVKVQVYLTPTLRFCCPHQIGACTKEVAVTTN